MNSSTKDQPGDRFTGESCRNFILGFIPLAGGDGHWETAMDKALEKGKGDLLLDVVVTLTGWSIILLSQECVEIEGTVSRSSSYRG